MVEATGVRVETEVKKNGLGERWPGLADCSSDYWPMLIKERREGGEGDEQNSAEGKQDFLTRIQKKMEDDGVGVVAFAHPGSKNEAWVMVLSEVASEALGLPERVRLDGRNGELEITGKNNDEVFKLTSEQSAKTLRLMDALEWQKAHGEEFKEQDFEDFERFRDLAGKLGVEDLSWERWIGLKDYNDELVEEVKRRYIDNEIIEDGWRVIGRFVSRGEKSIIFEGEGSVWCVFDKSGGRLGVERLRKSRFKWNWDSQGEFEDFPRISKVNMRRAIEEPEPGKVIGIKDTEPELENEKRLYGETSTFGDLILSENGIEDQYRRINQEAGVIWFRQGEKITDSEKLERLNWIWDNANESEFVEQRIVDAFKAKKRRELEEVQMAERKKQREEHAVTLKRKLNSGKLLFEGLESDEKAREVDLIAGQLLRAKEEKFLGDAKIVDWVEERGANEIGVIVSLGENKMFFYHLVGKSDSLMWVENKNQRSNVDDEKPQARDATECERFLVREVMKSGSLKGPELREVVFRMFETDKKHIWQIVDGNKELYVFNGQVFFNQGGNWINAGDVSKWKEDIQDPNPLALSETDMDEEEIEEMKRRLNSNNESVDEETGVIHL